MESDAQSTQLGASKLIIAHLEKQAWYTCRRTGQSWASHDTRAVPSENQEDSTRLDVPTSLRTLQNLDRLQTRKSGALSARRKNCPQMRIFPRDSTPRAPLAASCCAAWACERSIFFWAETQQDEEFRRPSEKFFEWPTKEKEQSQSLGTSFLRVLHWMKFDSYWAFPSVG